MIARPVPVGGRPISATVVVGVVAKLFPFGTRLLCR